MRPAPAAERQASSVPEFAALAARVQELEGRAGHGSDTAHQVRDSHHTDVHYALRHRTQTPECMPHLRVYLYSSF